MSNKLLRLPGVEDRTGLRKTALYQRQRQGTFPRPVTIGGRAVAWPESDINAWIEAITRGASEEELRELVQCMHDARGYKPDPRKQRLYDHVVRSRKTRAASALR